MKCLRRVEDNEMFKLRVEDNEMLRRVEDNEMLLENNDL